MIAKDSEMETILCDEGLGYENNLYVEAALLLKDYIYRRNENGFNVKRNAEKMYSVLSRISEFVTEDCASDGVQESLTKYGSNGSLDCNKGDIKTAASSIAGSLYDAVSSYSNEVKKRLIESDYYSIFKIITSSPKEFPDLYCKIGDDPCRVKESIQNAGAVDTIISAMLIKRPELLVYSLAV